MQHSALICVFALCVLAQAAYQPVAPQRGSYSWDLVVKNNGQDTFVGGRTIYDFVAGYMRMESWNTPDPSPGINGITLWDLRESLPIVSTIDQNLILLQAQCWVEKLNDNVLAPQPEDYSQYTFSKFQYWNRALAEEWIDGFGGYLYVDMFSRDVVGMGNESTADGAVPMYYNIYDWSDSAPDGTLFLLPNTLQCKPINSSLSSAEAVSRMGVHPMGGLLGGVKCKTCKLGIGAILGKLCNGGSGAAACASFPPAIPFCAILAQSACKNAGSLSKDTACKIIHMC